MVIPSSDPVGNFFEVAGKECAHEGIEQIKVFVEKFLLGKYAFIGERKTVDVARDQKKSREMKIYREHLEDGSKEIIFEMGLSLRKLEKEKDFERLENLKNKISIRYDLEGLRIAQAVQNKILFRYINELIEDGNEKEFISSRVSRFIEDIEGHAFFIQNEENADKALDKIILKIEVKSPAFFAISGKGSAMRIAGDIYSRLRENPVENYNIGQHFNEKEAMIFLKRK